MSIFHLTDKRLEQLSKEQTQDLKLIELSKQCPQVILHYLFTVRLMNRKYSTKVYESSIFNYTDNIQQSLQQQDKILNVPLSCPDLLKFCNEQLSFFQ